MSLYTENHLLAIMPVFTQQFLDDGKNLFISVKLPIAVFLFYPHLKDLPDNNFPPRFFWFVSQR